MSTFLLNMSRPIKTREEREGRRNRRGEDKREEKQDGNTTCDRVTSKLHGRINNFFFAYFFFDGGEADGRDWRHCC